MRSLLAIVSLTGCVFGDDIKPITEVDLPGDEPTAVDDDDGEPLPERLQPQVCQERAWPAVIDSGDVDLAITPTPSGAAIFSVAKGGGVLRGFAVDERGEVLRDNFEADDTKYFGVSTAFVDGRIGLAAVGERFVDLSVVREDFTGRMKLGRTEGTLVGAPILHAHDQRVAVVGGDGGLALETFDESWAANGNRTLTDEPVLAMASTAYRDDAIIAWSSAKACHAQRLGSGIDSTQAFACLGAQLAPTAQGGMLVYESEDGHVWRSDIVVGGERELANHVEIAHEGSAPRVAYDGKHAWISYIDGRGAVVIGFVDDDGAFISRSLHVARPQRDAYDLVKFGEHVWLVTADASGYAAKRLCLE